MKFKWGNVFSFLVILILILNSAAYSHGHHGLNAYLIFNNDTSIIKKDSLLQTNLRLRLGRMLNKNNIKLVSNVEMEAAGEPHLYIYINLNDSLRISAKESGADDSYIVIVPKAVKVYSYKNEKEVISKALAYCRKYLLRR